MNSKRKKLEPLKYILIINFSVQDLGEYFNGEKVKNASIAGIQANQGFLYSKIDFADFIPSNNSDDTIILNIEDSISSKIYHTLPKIDRCCKLNTQNIEYDGIDNMNRINCNLSREEFVKKYVNNRDAIMMIGCQEEWKAKNWTIDNLLDRFNYVKLAKNQISYHMANSVSEISEVRICK